MKIMQAILLTATLIISTVAAWSQGTPAPANADLYFITPVDGETIRGAFEIRFGLRNMGITHAGDEYPNSGHHHLLIDVDEQLEINEPIPRDKRHLHFGAGETETRIELPPGAHTLQLVLGDARHFPFNPPVISKKIFITVVPAQVQSGRGPRGSHRSRKRHRAFSLRESFQAMKPAIVVIRS